MGLPQFVPTSFLSYAIDFDGDGRSDIWNSVPDALASIANYLERHGWDSSIGWGEEVIYPSNITCALEGPEHGRSLADWQTLGLSSSTTEQHTKLHLLLPAGRLGPSFLVTNNFYVLRQYNRSDAYALFVGHLSDRIGGLSRGFDGQWSPTGDLTYGEIREIQLWLFQAGHDVATSGVMGYRTRIAVGLAQAVLGLAETCFPDRQLLEAVRQ